MNESPDNSKSPSEPQAEPLFIAISQTDPDLQSAYDRAAATVPTFIEHLQHGGEALFSAKLRFRDPNESEHIGQDRFVFLWLTGVHYYADERVFSGAFFEVPRELQKWHRTGDRITFDPEDIFDWMVLHEGHLRGGFTLRVARSRLPEAKRESYDHHVGVSVYEPLPT